MEPGSRRESTNAGEQQIRLVWKCFQVDSQSNVPRFASVDHDRFPSAGSSSGREHSGRSQRSDRLKSSVSCQKLRLLQVVKVKNEKQRIRQSTAELGASGHCQVKVSRSVRWLFFKAQAANAAMTLNSGEGALTGGLHQVQAALDTASFFRWSMNTCRLTSSVRMGAPDSWRKEEGRVNGG